MEGNGRSFFLQILKKINAVNDYLMHWKMKKIFKVYYLVVIYFLFLTFSSHFYKE